jgi:N-acetylneuraminate lyase
MKKFHGVYPALITPLDDSDQVNEGVVQDLVDWHLEAGVNGFYVAGSTGEGLLLSLQQRKDLTEAVMRATDGRATVIVHVGSVSTKAAVNLAQHANAVGAGAISAIPPIYYGVDPSSVVEHYSAIASATALPLFVYHIPSATHSDMTIDLMTSLLEIPTVKGIKFSDYNHSLMRRIYLLRPDLIVYSGNDDVFLSGLIMGAHGGIGLTYNFMPHLFVGIYRAFQSGDLARARELQWKVCDMIDTLSGIGSSNIAAAKVALQHLGFEVGEPQRPILPLTSRETEIAIVRLTELGLDQRNPRLS